MNITLYTQSKEISFKTALSEDILIYCPLDKSQKLIFLASFIVSIQKFYNISKEMDVEKIKVLSEALLDRYRTYSLSDFALIVKMHNQGLLKTTCYNAIDASNIYELIEQYDELRTIEHQRKVNEEIAKQRESIANAPAPEISKERLAEMRKEAMREHEILKKTRTLHFMEIANLCEMIILAYIKPNKEPDLTPQIVNQIYQFFESRKIIDLSNEEKSILHQSKINSNLL
jgi:hypothetical protein